MEMIAQLLKLIRTSRVHSQFLVILKNVALLSETTKMPEKK